MCSCDGSKQHPPESVLTESGNINLTPGCTSPANEARELGIIKDIDENARIIDTRGI